MERAQVSQNMSATLELKESQLAYLDKIAE